MKLSVEEASDNFTRFSKRLKNEELRNLLKHQSINWKWYDKQL